MSNDDNNYYRIYYMIRAILFGGSFNESLLYIKELGFDTQYMILYYLNDLIKLNDSNHLINKNTKKMIEEILFEISSLYRNTVIFRPLNCLINHIKVNLNNAHLYDEEAYLLSELSYKMGVENILDNSLNWGPIVRSSINNDYLLYDDMLFGDIKIEDGLNIFKMFTINTYLRDVNGVRKNQQFIQNARTVVDSTLEYLQKYKSILPSKQTKLYKKNINKILKRIK